MTVAVLSQSEDIDTHCSSVHTLVLVLLWGFISDKNVLKNIIVTSPLHLSTHTE